ncbi:NAD(P)H-binding protein [Catenulispora subtropica]|uniref:NAD(P)H-binding protein n=1 Tax=Catenulispora subtropica TaxID=450798 RepID=A0ABP5DKG3_9ACTN
MKHTLILAGTGKTGRRVASRLTSAGHPVRTAARTGGDVHFDLDDAATWPAALDGVAAAYLVEPSLEAGAEHPPRIARLVAAAVAAGVRRLVLLSAPGADVEGHPLHTTDLAVRTSGVEWTVLRPNWFSQNFSEDFWLPAVRGGTLALPTGQGRVPFIDAEDIADVAAAALTEDRHAGQVYALTGPRAISFGEAAELIATASGRPLRYVDTAPDDFLQQQLSYGIPQTAAERLTQLLVSISTGGHEDLHDGVQRALGRAPRRFEDFVVEAAATGCWS